MPAASPWRIWQWTNSYSVFSTLGLSRLPPYRSPILKCRCLLPYLPRREYSVSSPIRPGSGLNGPVKDESLSVTIEARGRKIELDNSGVEQYPRYTTPIHEKVTIKEFQNQIQNAELQSNHEDDRVSEVLGRITSIRLSGNKLAFIDIHEDSITLQVVLQHNTLTQESVTPQAFKSHCRLMRRGDFISVQGRPHITETGQASIKAICLPKIVSPCLQPFPVEKSRDSAVLETLEARPIDKYIEYITDPRTRQFLNVRSEMMAIMRNHFRNDKFLEVETPILSAAAGGASARPFETTATEFSDRKLSLRIAPELWLKRLIIGGLTRVYEIGPCFRNEGLDKTHNPEFTTCEFYAVREDLTGLKERTERLLREIASKIPMEDSNTFKNQQTMIDFFSGPYKEVDFIPALNKALQVEIPNLTSATAQSELLEIFKAKDIPLPTNPSLPRLLDKLSSTYLEPQCDKPTWISYIPECLSPLSKSFIHPTAPNNQPVAARAELFVKGQEIVNCYEEENDPIVQRRKFMDQQRYARDSESGVMLDDEMMSVDEDYLRALEWGLPPTGGWGCGIDRLVMLFTGKERISDVLSFGNLRAVTRGAEKWNK